MIKKIIGIILLCTPLIIQAESSMLQEESLEVQPSEQCKILTCIGGHTNNIDNQLAKLIAERLGYIQKEGGPKSQPISVYDRSRHEDKISNSVGKQLEKIEYRSGTAPPIFKKTVEQTNYYNEPGPSY